MTLDEFLQVAEWHLNMMRIFNARGLTRENATLQKKFFRPLLCTGPTASGHYTSDEFEQMKDLYYRLAGWDLASGNPMQEELESLGRGWVERGSAF